MVNGRNGREDIRVANKKVQVSDGILVVLLPSQLRNILELTNSTSRMY
jgi:hypothetical protein